MAVATADTTAKEAVSPSVATPTGVADLLTAGNPSPLVSVIAGDAAPGAMAPPTLQTQPTPGPAAPPSTVPQAPDRSPAGQVAPVMVSLASSGTGTHRLVLHLEPPELGRLEISLARAPETGARVEITAERPSTLALLRQDEPALHRALTEAGVPTDGRSLTMQLGQPGAQYAGGQGGGQGNTGPRRFAVRAASLDGSEGFSDPSPLPALRDIRSVLDITA